MNRVINDDQIEIKSIIKKNIKECIMFCRLVNDDV